MAKVAVEQVYTVRLVRVMALFGFNAVAGLRFTHKFSVQSVLALLQVWKKRGSKYRVYDEV